MQEIKNIIRKIGLKKHRLLPIIIVLTVFFITLTACEADLTETSLGPTNIKEINVEDVEDTKSVGQSFPETTTSENVSSPKGDLKVHFIDVGQGDSTFIELPNGETMLIDAGPTVGIVPDYIESCEYNSITYVVATHPDADHITGMAEVLNTFNVDAFYMPEKEHTTKTFENMINAVADNGCDAIYAEAGKQIIDTSDLKLYFVGPVKIYDDNNACSAVVKLEYGQTSFLFTGDAEETSEVDMISAGYDLNANVLKVGHHGSSTSTSETFIKAISPKDAIISVGADNSYGHPTAETLAILNNAGVNVYRTDELGTIIVTSDGVNYTIDNLESTIKVNAPSDTIVVMITQPTTESQTTSQNNTNVDNSEDSNSDGSSVVYITATGSKYHSAGCSYLKGSSTEVTLEEAKSRGLTACSRCNPP